MASKNKVGISESHSQSPDASRLQWPILIQTRRDTHLVSRATNRVSPLPASCRNSPSPRPASPGPRYCWTAASYIIMNTAASYMITDFWLFGHAGQHSPICSYGETLLPLGDRKGIFHVFPSFWLHEVFIMVFRPFRSKCRHRLDLVGF